MLGIIYLFRKLSYSKDLCKVSASPSYVVRIPYGYNSRYSWHVFIIWKPVCHVNELSIVSPEFPSRYE